MRHCVLALAAAAGAALLAVGAKTASAAPAPAALPLTGEALIANSTATSVGPETFVIGSSQLNGTCNPTGTSTFSFAVDGFAVGPYPGTFSETGTFALAPAAFDAAIGGINFMPISFDASFTITSPAGTVTGTKTLSNASGTNFGVCGSKLLSQPGITAGDNAANLQISVTYSAQLTTPAGTFTDTGSGDVQYGDEQVTNAPADFTSFSFAEEFVSESFIAAGFGKSTGGGEVAPAVTFGFVAMRQPNGTLQGNCDVVDHLLGVDVKCLDVMSYLQTMNHATFKGDATVDGMPTTYTIDVVDNGEPGTGDTFAITTGNGYAAGGMLTAGNIQVH